MNTDTRIIGTIGTNAHTAVKAIVLPKGVCVLQIVGATPSGKPATYAIEGSYIRTMFDGLKTVWFVITETALCIHHERGVMKIRNKDWFVTRKPKLPARKDRDKPEFDGVCEKAYADFKQQEYDRIRILYLEV